MFFLFVFFFCPGIWIMNYASEILQQVTEEELWEGKKLTFIDEHLLRTRC